MAKVTSKSDTPKILFYTALVIILSILFAIFFFIIRDHVLRQRDNEAFQKTTSFIDEVYDKATEVAGEPLYIDKAEYCYWRSPGKFQDDRLYCDIELTGYYRLDQAGSKELATITNTIFKDNLGVSFLQIDQNKGGTVLKYQLPNQKINELSKMECAAEMQYPEKKTEWISLSARSFETDDVMSISISCSREVQSPLYPMSDV